MWMRDSRSVCVCANENSFMPHHILFTWRKKAGRGANSVLGIKCKDNADSGMEFLCGYYANNKNHFYEQWKHWTSVVGAVVVVIAIVVEYTAICIKLAHNFVVDFLFDIITTHIYIYICWVVVQQHCYLPYSWETNNFRTHTHTSGCTVCKTLNTNKCETS